MILLQNIVVFYIIRLNLYHIKYVAIYYTIYEYL